MGPKAILEFVRDSVGRTLQSPGGLGGQCVDLVELWWLNWGLPAVPGNAVDLYVNGPSLGYSATQNTPTNYPAAGDVVIWHEYGPRGISVYGHCAIALMAGENAMLTLDQDWPWGQPTRLNVHDYDGVLGWLSMPGR